ncbi:MAG: hypothetical protein Q4C70_09720 [Planctomycetia bacterium]|nr:hypothetical protein [Planctomycetia bacterium]
MRFQKWLSVLVLGLSVPVSVSAAPTWSPDPGGTELIGNTTVTLDGNLTLDRTYTSWYSMSFNLKSDTSAATVEVKNVQEFTGGVNVGNGVTLKLNQTEGNRGAGYGAIRGTITLEKGGKIDIATGSQTGYGANATKWALNGGQLINSTSDKIATMNQIDIRGDVTISGNSTHDLGTFALDNKFSVHSGNVTINTNKIALAARYGETKYQQDFYIYDGSLVTINGELADISSTAAGGWEGGNARSLRKTGGGTLLINTVTSYTGSTIAYRGTLKIGVDNPFPTSKFEMSDKAVGILDLNGHNATLNLASNIYGNIMNSAADTTSVATLNIAEGEAYEVSGVIKNGTGKTAVIVTGGGTLNVAKAQTFSGGLTIENGTVTLSGSGDGIDDFTKYGVIRNTITVEKDGVLELLTGSAFGYGRKDVQGAPTLTVNGGKIDNTKSSTHNLL